MSSPLEQALVDLNALEQPENKSFPIVDKTKASLKTINGLNDETIDRLTAHIDEDMQLLQSNA